MKWYTKKGTSTYELPASVIKSKNSSVHVAGSLLSERKDILTDGKVFLKKIIEIVNTNGAEVMGYHTTQFTSNQHEQSGYTMALVLAESHPTIHTWPELGMVELDVYLCNVLQDNRSRCRIIYRETVALFCPTKEIFVEIPRPDLSKIEDRDSVTSGELNVVL